MPTTTALAVAIAAAYFATCAAKPAHHSRLLDRDGVSTPLSTAPLPQAVASPPPPPPAFSATPPDPHTTCPIYSPLALRGYRVLHNDTQYAWAPASGWVPLAAAPPDGGQRFDGRQLSVALWLKVDRRPDQLNPYEAVVLSNGGEAADERRFFALRVSYPTRTLRLEW